jgi:hypothetical protein
MRFDEDEKAGALANREGGDRSVESSARKGLDGRTQRTSHEENAETICRFLHESICTWLDADSAGRRISPHRRSKRHSTQTLTSNRVIALKKIAS